MSGAALKTGKLRVFLGDIQSSINASHDGNAQTAEINGVIGPDNIAEVAEFLQSVLNVVVAEATGACELLGFFCRVGIYRAQVVHAQEKAHRRIKLINIVNHYKPCLSSRVQKI